MRRLFPVFVILVLAGCATLALNHWDDLYGVGDPKRFDQPQPSATISYQHDVQPILEQRCVVCHGCYDAPCQLKLTAYEGVTRGASKVYIYDSNRLLAAEPSRLLQDELSTAAWRKRDFFPVLNERRNDADTNIEASVMAQLLLQKQAHPLPEVTVLPDSFDFRLHRDQQCTDIEHYAEFRDKFPLWGMPYGLPGLNQTEHNTLIRWLEAGAPYDPPPALTASLQNRVQQWERFFNQDSLQAQLMSRYMYEHLFPAHLYFDDSSKPVFFELVRSRTPAPQPIDLISTRRPYDDPHVKRVYYRLRRHQETILSKTHLPYRLDDKRMANWNKWFLATDLHITKLPDYDIKTASNPFITFQQLPSYARYRFLLEEAQYTIQAFIKGPVCRGQIALNVINDHFWVTFLHPKYQTAELNSDFLRDNANLLKLPARDSSSSGLLNWISYGRYEQQFMEAKTRLLNEKVDKEFSVSTDLLWDGDGDNRNAALTIYRHFDSASVIKGLHGGHPQSAWVMTYPLLERIHYLLVAGFDVFGNVGHQLNTRIYMDFLRMEGEFHFLTLLPRDAREKVRNRWYRGSVNQVKEYIFKYASTYEGDTAEQYHSQHPLAELYDKLEKKLAPVLDHQHDFQQDRALLGKATLDELTKLARVKGIPASLMPQLTFMELDLADGNSLYYTLISNNAYTNISHLFDDANRRLPKEDNLTLGRGLIGSYPNVFLKVSAAQLPELVQRISGLRNHQDYIGLLDQFAVRRTSDQFWPFSDRMNTLFQQRDPLHFGYMDYNRFDNE